MPGIRDTASNRANPPAIASDNIASPAQPRNSALKEGLRAALSRARKPASGDALSEIIASTGKGVKVNGHNIDDDARYRYIKP